MALTQQRKAEIDSMLNQQSFSKPTSELTSQSQGMTQQRRAEIDSMLAKPTAQEQIKEKGGFVGDLVKDVAKPFVSTLASGLGSVEGAYKMATSAPGGFSQRELADIDKATTRERDFGIFGKARPINITKTGEQKGVVEFAKDVIGTGVEIGSYIAPVGIGAKAISRAGATGIGKAALTTSAGGVLGGSVGEFGAALREAEGIEDTGEILKRSAYGGLAGGVLGGAIGTAGSALASRAAIKAGVPEAVARTVNEVTGVYDNLINTNKTHIKLANEFQSKHNISLPRYLAQSGVPIHTTDNGTKFATNAIGNEFGKESLSLMGNTLDDVLIQHKGSMTINLNKARQEAIAEISNKLYILPGRRDQNINAINKFIDEQINDFSTNIIDIPTGNDVKRSFWNASFGAEEALSKRPAAEAIGDSLKRQVENSVADPIVKNINKEMAKIIDARKYLLKIDGDAVRGGRLGSGYVRLIGMMASMKMGPVGSMIGGEILQRIVARVGSVERLSVKQLRILEQAGIVPSYIKTDDAARKFIKNLIEERQGRLLLEQGAMPMGQKAPSTIAEEANQSRLFTQPEAKAYLEEMGTLPGRFRRAINSTPKLLNEGTTKTPEITQPPIPLRGPTTFESPAKKINMQPLPNSTARMIENAPSNISKKANITDDITSQIKKAKAEGKTFAEFKKTQEKLIGEKLHIANKKAKEIRDEVYSLKSELFEEEPKYAMEPESGTWFTTEQDYSEWMNDNFSSLDKDLHGWTTAEDVISIYPNINKSIAKDIIDNPKKWENGKIDTFTGDIYTSKEWNEYLEPIETSIKEIEEKHEKIKYNSDFRNLADEIYLLKDEIIEKLDIEPVALHRFMGDENNIYPMYEIGDFQFHNKVDLEDWIEETGKNVKLEKLKSLENISSDKEISKKFNEEEDLNFLRNIKSNIELKETWDSVN